MTYRDDLQAARMRREALNHELHQMRSRIDAYQELIRQERALEQELAQCARDMDQARARVELPLLKQVRVASPCKQRWDDMTGDERVRFCGRCAKHVYDLSALTAAQAEALLRENGESKCVRFFRRSDGTILTSDCPVGGESKRFWRRVTTLAVASGLAAAGLTMAAGASYQGNMEAASRDHIEWTSEPAGTSEARVPNESRPPRQGEVEMGNMGPPGAVAMEALNQRIEETRARLQAATAERIAAERELESLESEARKVRELEQHRRDPRIEISDACRKNPLDC